MNGGRGCPVEAVAGAPTQAEADAQVAWDTDNIQCLGILGLHLSPNLRTHLGNTACLTWDSLNTMFGQPGMSAIFADYQAAISFKVTGGQNPLVEIQQLNTLFECLAANSMSISDPMQGMILLNALPVKWDSVGMVYLQSTCQLINVSFQAVREVVMAEFEHTTCPSTIAMNKISAVKRKGKSPTFSEQKHASNQAPPALVEPLGSQKKKWKGGKGKARAHEIVSSALIPQAIAKWLQETHHIALLAPCQLGLLLWWEALHGCQL